jgi:DNA recombination protein RmuC
MDGITLLALGFGLLFGLAVAVFALRARPSTKGADQGQALAEITGRLSQMAESQAAQQVKVAEQLQAQERAVRKALEERLGDFSKKVGDSLQETSTRSQEALTDLRERLAVIDKAQQNIKELSGQVVGLQDILSNKQARGAFGEVQLQAIVEAVLPPSAYAFQVKLSNARVVDCMLSLPNPPGPIAIDSKFPLESYETLRAAESEEQVKLARRAFSRDLRKHINDIAEKYILPGETADGAILFLPSEAVYAELHTSFRQVVDESYRAKVWIVCPTTLWATLTTILAVLRDVQMREQATIIQKEVGFLVGDIQRLGERVGKLDSHFDQAQRDIEQIKISAGKIISRGDRITSLELEEGEETPEQEISAVSGPPRLV